MTGFKPHAEDWPRAPLFDNPRLRVSDGVLRRPYTPEDGWIATNGEDLSGHDFGCAVLLVMDNTVADGWEPVRTEHVGWDYVTHYMLTNIRTPEPPE